jgi:hypothetical protein
MPVTLAARFPDLAAAHSLIFNMAWAEVKLQEIPKKLTEGPFGLSDLASERGEKVAQ